MGVANQDSDYDVKGVYVPNDLNAYARLADQQDVVTRQFGEFEYELWDVSKFADLLHQSNDQAIQFVQSPVIYRNTMGDDLDELREFIEANYNPMALYHKYRAIAANNYRKYLSAHLNSNHDTNYPIIERREGEYLVALPNECQDDELVVPKSAVDGDEKTPLSHSAVRSVRFTTATDKCSSEPVKSVM